ncbi:hypothetical protein HY251_21835 [bacterium]|nr:hypothetical protein [bacterium]
MLYDLIRKLLMTARASASPSGDGRFTDTVGAPLVALIGDRLQDERALLVELPGGPLRGLASEADPVLHLEHGVVERDDARETVSP